MGGYEWHVVSSSLGKYSRYDDKTILVALFSLGLSVAVGFLIILNALFKASGLWAPVGIHWFFKSRRIIC